MTGGGGSARDRLLKTLVSMAMPPGASGVLFGKGGDSESSILRELEEADAEGVTGDSTGPETSAWLRELRRGLAGSTEGFAGEAEARDRDGQVPGAEVYARRWAARRRDLEMEAVSVAAGALLFGTAVFGALASLDAGGVVPVAAGIGGTLAWAFSFGSDVVRELLEGETRPPE